MKVFKIVDPVNNGEITIAVPKIAITRLNEIINRYNQSQWGDNDDVKKKQLNKDLEDDILELYRLFNPS
jgi:hypothetical protein